MAFHYKTVAGCAENDVYHVGFLKKVLDLQVHPLNDGEHAIFFRRYLELTNVICRTSEMKRILQLAKAQIQELTEEDWSQQCASAQENTRCSSSPWSRHSDQSPMRAGRIVSSVPSDNRWADPCLL